MKSPAFIVKHLSIRKIPGFPVGIKTYKDFAPNINIIAGPNASGKSSTARVLKQLIWPNNTEGISAEGSAVIENDKWDVKIDSKSVKVQRQGIDDKFPGIPALETSKRYDLALHELVKDEDEDIAIEILRQSSGGYNLDDARNNLAYSKRIKDKAAKEFKEYNEAKNNQISINQVQKNLLKEEENLKNLYEGFNKAKEAFGLKDLYQKLIAFLNARMTFNLTSEQHKNFPGEMDALSGKEYVNIKELQNEIDNTDKAIENAKIRIKDCDLRLSELKLPDGGLSDIFISELNERLEKISEDERQIKEANLKIERSATLELEALKILGESINPEKWMGLNLKKLNDLDQFLQKAHKIISEKQFLEAQIEVLKRDLVEDQIKAEVLNDGIRSLSLFLQEQNSSSGTSKWLTLSLSVASILTAIVTSIIGWPGLIGIALIMLLTFLAYKSSPKTDSLVRKNDYDKTKLPHPKTWSIKGVTDKMQELISLLNESQWQSGIKQKINIYNSELENLEPHLDKINISYKEWMKDLEAMPEMPTDDLKNYIGLYWFIERVNKWQEAHTAHKLALTEKTLLSNSFKDELEKLNQLFQPYIINKAEDYLGAKSIVNSLRESENIRRDAIKESGHLKTQLLEYERQKNTALKKAEEIYSGLNIPVGDIGRIKNLLMSLDDFKKSKEALQEAKILMTEKGNLIKAHSLFNENKSILEALSLDQAEASLKEFEADADQFERLNKEITEIETNIRHAKGSNSLEDALKKQEEALIQLEHLYENNLSAIAGDLIINQLKERSRKYNQPQVLIRANELFTNITSGRYRLLIEDKNESSLRAYDNELNLGQDLSELSTGTRIQLLLSVRIAFIEMQEGMIKLPIMADELLANSDDIRAKAIIEALIKISKDGRQIFYFTAQDDEVSKWKYYLDKDKDIRYNLFNLTGSGNESANSNNDVPEYNEFEIIQKIPLPEKLSHKEYGTLIQVPPFNILIGNPNQIHIWYLTTDNKLIYNCLKKGIRKWGQLINYIENSGIIEGLEEDTLNIFREKILFVQRFIELHRKGRPRPIDREVLEQTDAVTANFIDEVNSKLTELNGDPAKLIAALKNGEVNKFRSNKSEELEQYLRDEGYIDDYEALDKTDILIQLNAFLSGLELEDSEAQEFVDLLLGAEVSD